MRHIGIFVIATSLLTLASGSAGFAQQGGPQTNMQGHGMGTRNMQTMMNQCTAMRQQMRPGAPMSPSMQTMMRQCDDMDRQMGSTSQPAAPRVRTR
ncbi:MAG: hypothetical protein NVSMB18_06630 [Acetobacteraceae bacterium]